MDQELLDRLERIVKMYERAQEMELRKAEIGAKIASDIMNQNRQSTMDLMKYFSQFVTPITPIKPKDE
jgi:hypothetical protein